MKRIFTSLAFVLLLNATAFAAGRPVLNINYDRNGTGALRLEGRNLCDSDRFRVRIVDSLTGDSGWYRSNRGNTEWPIERTRYGDCKISMQLSKNILVPGYVLQAVTYAGGYRTHQIAKVIPCEMTEEQLVTVFVGEFQFDVVVEQPIDCRAPAPAPVPQPQQSCRTEVRANQQEVGLNVSCDLVPEYVSARLLDNAGNVLCGNVSFQVGQYPARACTSFARNPMHRLDYRVEIMTSQRQIFTAAGTILKDSSWTQPPNGNYTTPLELAPAPQKKAFGRGTYWDFTVGAQVSDADVDPSEGQSLIKVELIDMASGRAIRSTMANSGQEVRFDLEHQYVVPKVFGKPKETGDLARGANRVFMRVWDAYNGNTYIDLPVVNISIN